MYPLGTRFVSGICVWITCIKETMMMTMIMVMMMMIIITTTYAPPSKNITIAVKAKCNLWIFPFPI